MKEWKTLKEEDVSPSKWFPVSRQTVELGNGQIVDDYYISPMPDAVIILPVLKNGDFVLVNQYKHAIGEIVIEYPAGYQKDGVSPEQTVVEELEEEVGIKINIEDIISLGKTSICPTKIKQRSFLYLVKDVEFNSQQNLDPTEDIEILTASPQEVLNMVKDGRIWAADTVACTMQAYLQYPELFK